MLFIDLLVRWFGLVKFKLIKNEMVKYCGYLNIDRIVLLEIIVK